LVRANGVDLCVETFGDPTSPTILLIAGAACSMDWWEDAFCEQVAAGRRHVVRYDLRDTGESVSCPAGAPTYTGADLAADAVGLLDELRVASAHVVGMSMGGGIAQRIARDDANRVATLTLMSTSSGAPGLPPMTDALAAFFAHPPPQPDWSNVDAVVEYVVEGERPYSGSLGFDEARARELAARSVARTIDVEASLTNHSLIESGAPARRPLSEIQARTLVIHGTADPLFPIAHGEALAAEIPGARLLVLEGLGHELPPRQLWDRVVPAILHHTA
jgi:pimeloyl-ACP methyl ester carboxylesterase